MGNFLSLWQAIIVGGGSTANNNCTVKSAVQDKSFAVCASSDGGSSGTVIANHPLDCLSTKFPQLNRAAVYPASRYYPYMTEVYVRPCSVDELVTCLRDNGFTQVEGWQLETNTFTVQPSSHNNVYFKCTSTGNFSGIQLLMA